MEASSHSCVCACVSSAQVKLQLQRGAIGSGLFRAGQTFGLVGPNVTNAKCDRGAGAAAHGTTSHNIEVYGAQAKFQQNQ